MRRDANSNALRIVTRGDMISPSTTAMILNLLRADPGATASEIQSTRQFFDTGCQSETARIAVNGGLLLTKSAGARLLGVSRTQFTKIALAKDANGQPQFAEHYVANETFPRYSKIELIEYTMRRPERGPQIPHSVEVA